ncbi:MAG TPA: outer membrane beta-barrel protein [Candidatus Kapabacteria bacterium]|nr:outer membrane beta-barrel protein [Candidatus Kapabacteria bacterium]
MKRILLATLLGMFTLGLAAAHAQVRANAIGAKLGLYFDGSKPMIGVNGEIPFTSELDFEPAAELVFGIQNTTLVILDANGRYSFNLQGSEVRPYLLGGLGVGVSFVSVNGTSKSDTDFRLNLGGGMVFNSRSLIQYWAGLKVFVLSKSSDVGIQGGVNFYL